jgi:two-component system chemotaxis response regulator CheY
MSIPSDTIFLVVDDASSAQTMIVNILLNYGIKENCIATASDTAGAMREIDKRRSSEDLKVRFIICDWHMPGDTGLHLLKQVRLIPSMKKTPFILCTTENSRRNVMDAIDADVSNYIIKPWTEKYFVDKLEETWHKKED